MLTIRKKMKKEKRIFVCLIGAAIVQILVLLGMTTYWNILRQGFDETEWSSLMKIKSNGNPDLLAQFIIKTDKITNRNKTTGKLSTVMEIAVAQITRKNYDSDKNPEYLALNVTEFGCTPSQRTVSTIQLYDIASHEIPVPGKQTKVYWNSKQGIEIAIKALLEEGVISIQQSGYFYVTSMLTLRAENVTSTGAAKHTAYIMSHVVNVIHHKGETESILLENVKSSCELAFGHADWSSNIGAGFYLNEHDRVYVATSHPYNIVSGHSNNYLNIHTIL